MASNGRHPVVDEVVFWEDGITLYSAGDFLAANDSEDASKLQGEFLFPFSLKLPSRIARSNSANSESRSYKLPPTFYLSSDQGMGGMSGQEFASVRYFVKTTLGRKGILKSNVSFFFFFDFSIFFPLVRFNCSLLILYSGENDCTDRLLAKRSSTFFNSFFGIRNLFKLSKEPNPILPLAEAPRSWIGKKVTQSVKRGVFTGRKG